MTLMNPRRMGNKRGKPEMDRFTTTHYLLLAQFGNRSLILIEEIAEDLLGLSVATAKKRASNRALPFPVLRLGESQKSPWLVHIDDLVKYIDAKTIKARNEWILLNS
ncbi:pyocin activator PrtN family protein [Vibrio sp. S17_S38]|uniref:pyocin activator PrtN family protein n=1 Tax=Vibrio sp. S17_S38 TaxID=2720229 RepID=UPI001EEF1302|nr:pyocin activator PrtN family protein [Vibrio sp. S17_S38]